MGFLKLPERQQDDFDFEDDFYPEEEAVIDSLRTRSHGIRPEIIMGIVAILAAVLLALVFVFSMPYMFRDEDPETSTPGELSTFCSSR